MSDFALPCRFRGCRAQAVRPWTGRIRERLRTFMLCDDHYDLCEKVTTSADFTFRALWTPIPHVWVVPVLALRRRQR